MADPLTLIAGWSASNTEWLAGEITKYEAKTLNAGGWPTGQKLSLPSAARGARVLIGAGLMQYVDELNELGNVTWHMLWRDPVILCYETLRRGVDIEFQRQFFLKLGWESSIFLIADRLASLTELFLRDVEATGKLVTHWHHRKYTSKSGLIALLRSMTINVTGDVSWSPVPLSQDIRPDKPVPRPIEWSSSSREYTRRTFMDLPLSRQAYVEALASSRS